MRFFKVEKEKKTRFWVEKLYKFKKNGDMGVLFSFIRSQRHGH